MAKLYFHYATMNAGKTTMLLQASYNYGERGMATMLFVAGHYRKADQGYISSRIGLEAEAEMFRDGDDLFSRIAEHNEHTRSHCVFVDEAQFLDEEQVWQLARVADRLGIPVMCYGLRTDFQGKLFSGSHALLAIADELREVAPSAAAAKRRRWWSGSGRTARLPSKASRWRSARSLCLALPPPLGGGDGSPAAGGFHRVCLKWRLSSDHREVVERESAGLLVSMASA